MNTIVLVCGSDSSGKTSTLKGFFSITAKNSPSILVKREIDGMTICAVSFGSVQEELNKQEIKQRFCNYEQVLKNIEKRVQTCDSELKGKPYILLIPFTMSASDADRKKLNHNCIIKPFEELSKKFNVFPAYLRKARAQNQEQKDALMKQINAYFIIPDTIKTDCDRSNQLETYIRQKIIPTIL